MINNILKELRDTSYKRKTIILCIRYSEAIKFLQNNRDNDMEGLIKEFLEWFEEEGKCSFSTTIGILDEIDKPLALPFVNNYAFALKFAIDNNSIDSVISLLYAIEKELYFKVVLNRPI